MVPCWPQNKYRGFSTLTKTSMCEKTRHGGKFRVKKKKVCSDFFLTAVSVSAVTNSVSCLFLKKQKQKPSHFSFCFRCVSPFQRRPSQTRDLMSDATVVKLCRVNLTWHSAAPLISFLSRRIGKKTSPPTSVSPLLPRPFRYRISGAGSSPPTSRTPGCGCTAHKIKGNNNRQTVNN